MSETSNRDIAPRDDLFRGRFPGEIAVEERDEGSGPVLHGHFAVFNEWTEINSMFEGNFMERIAPGAFRKTFKESGDKMKVLFQHGRDPQIGDKVLGIPSVLEEDDTGARYEVPLFDTSYNKDLLPGLRAGAYGASFRFRVVREEWNEEPDPSEDNPKGLPERTLTEVGVMEAGPVTFGAYDGATSGLRSLTDDFRIGTVTRKIEVEVTDARALTSADTPQALATSQTDTSEPERQNEQEKAAPSHPAEEPRRDTRPAPETTTVGGSMNLDELRARRAELKTEIETISTENIGQSLDADTKARWDAATRERAEITRLIEETEERLAYVDEMDREGNVESGVSERGSFYTAPRRDTPPDNPYDLSEYHSRASSPEQLTRVYSEGAKRAITNMRFGNPSADQAACRDQLERLVHEDGPTAEVAQRVLIFGSPLYRSAYWKRMTGQPMNPDETRAMNAGLAFEAQRAISTAQTGGITVPIQIDPTVIPTSNGVLNPFRVVSRNVQTTSYLWQAVTSAGVTAQYRAEATRMSDNAPTLNAPTIQPERADAFVPFSWEAGQDWGALESELAPLFSDAKDALEATKFASGAGHASNEPQGIFTGAGTLVGTTLGTAFGVADLYAMEAALPPRYLPNATWLTTVAMYQKVRQLDTAGGANLWVQLPGNNPAELIGYRALKASTVGTAGASLTSSARWGVFGDFSRYVIVDRIGMQTRFIENLFSGNTAGGIAYPTGQSGAVLYWRNSAGVVDSNAFRVGTIT